MTELFIDTSGWANLIDISQPYHNRAVKIYHDHRSKKHKMITTNYIICELNDKIIIREKFYQGQLS